MKYYSSMPGLFVFVPFVGAAMHYRVFSFVVRRSLSFAPCLVLPFSLFGVVSRACEACLLCMYAQLVRHTHTHTPPLCFRLHNGDSVCSVGLDVLE